jgi:hypothetical protein
MATFTVRVADLKLHAPAAQTLRGAVSLYTGHTTLEDAVISLDGVAVHFLAARIGSVDGQGNRARRTHR